MSLSNGKKYHDPAGRSCACGQPALKRKCGNFVCARCDALEQQYEREHNTRSYTYTRQVREALRAQANWRPAYE